MKDRECVILLRRVLPLVEMRWEGFRKVRRQVCRRIEKRMDEIGAHDIYEYIEHIEKSPGETALLDTFCRITISRFFRDRSLFETLIKSCLTSLAEKARSGGGTLLRFWSAGSASGEEAYTLKIIWEEIFRERYPGLDIRITGTDIDPHMVARAEEGRYSYGSVKELPGDLREVSFRREGESYLLKEKYREGVEFQVQDIRNENPAGPFQIILCRYLAFTYFNEALQSEIVKRLSGLLTEGGALVIGSHGKLPSGDFGLVRCEESSLVYIKGKQ
jgi:chemotaxis protein methyltransferase CheR